MIVGKLETGHNGFPVKALRNFAQANSCPRSEKRPPSAPLTVLRNFEPRSTMLGIVRDKLDASSRTTRRSLTRGATHSERAATQTKLLGRNMKNLLHVAVGGR